MPTTKHWTTEPDGELNVKTTLSGPASVPPITINELFKRVTKKYSAKTALRVKRGGQWITWTFKDYYTDATRAAKSMISLGVEPHQGACILGFNAPEWHISYMAAIMSGAIACGIYATNSSEACYYIANDCNINIAIAENKAQVAKFLQVRDRLPHLKAIVQYSPENVDHAHRDAGVLSWKEFLDFGKDLPDYEVQWRIERQKPGHCCSLIYTSGTTGTPKGVMVSHDNCMWTSGVCSVLYGLGEEDHMISYLPLSHIAAQMMDILTPLHTGLTIHFARPDAMKGSLLDTLKEVNPTCFVGVPRVWEKFREKIEMQLSQVSGFKGFVLERSKNIGRETSLNRQSGLTVAWGYWMANTFVFKSLRERMGLARCRLMGSAAAPIAREVLDFFLDFDMPIYELYGMSESSGPQAISYPGNHKTGAVGKVFPGAEIGIDNPGPNGDGEICMRGRHVFMGYLNDDKKTKETIDENGWLHSGDIGRMDSDGYVYITGRIKEILITRGGENVAPIPIENSMLEYCKILSACMVVGDNQKYLTMLMTLRCKIDEESKPTDELDAMALSVLQSLGSTATTATEARDDPKVIAYIEDAIKKTNGHAISRAAVVQKFRILPVDFSISGGELTPTMKLKRRVVLEKYTDLVEDMYREAVD